MSEMVERVARAICADLAWGAWNDHHEDKQAYIAASGHGITDVNGPFKSDFRGMARAAIAAMRDPPDHVQAAIEAMAEERYRAAPDMQRWYGEDVWNAGVDAALAEDAP